MRPELARIRELYDQAAGLKRTPATSASLTMLKKASAALKRAVNALDDLKALDGHLEFAELSLRRCASQSRAVLLIEIEAIEEEVSRLSKLPARRGDRSDLSKRVLFQLLARQYEADTGESGGEWSDDCLTYMQSALTEIGCPMEEGAVQHYLRKERKRRANPRVCGFVEKSSNPRI